MLFSSAVLVVSLAEAAVELVRSISFCGRNRRSAMTDALVPFSGTTGQRLDGCAFFTYANIKRTIS